MELQDKNWQNFCDNHLGKWHGSRTRYSGQGEVKEWFEAFRIFQANSDQTEITHTNRNIYADGTTEEKIWQFTKHSNNFHDGIMHPITERMRFLALEQGAAAGIFKKIEEQASFAVELFLRYENLRYSLVIIYGKDGSLASLTLIRDDLIVYPNNYWSNEVNLIAERNLSGNWIGKSIKMTPDLNVSAELPAELQETTEGNETLFFPNEISLSCPKEVKVGKPANITTTWLSKPDLLQQISVNYDDLGDFTELKFAKFSIQK